MATSCHLKSTRHPTRNRNLPFHLSQHHRRQHHHLLKLIVFVANVFLFLITNMNVQLSISVFLQFFVTIKSYYHSTLELLQLINLTPT
jgi:hypothetical protein